MPEIPLTIAGRVYRLACDEGEEGRLGSLAAILDGKIAHMRDRFGELGDQRLTVMAAISLADELLDATGRIRALEGEIADLVGRLQESRQSEEALTERLATCLAEAAERIERVARDLESAHEPAQHNVAQDDPNRTE